MLITHKYYNFDCNQGNSNIGAPSFCCDSMSTVRWHLASPSAPPPPPEPTFKYLMEPSAPSNSREMRNRAEKMRRDKLNSYIGELATLVPMVARSSKKMDKTSILRLTATHLRIYQTLLNGNQNMPHFELPKQADQSILEQICCEQLGGFLMILTTNGKIVFVSSTVENLLGYLQTDLMGQSIFTITPSTDHDRLRMYLTAFEGIGDQIKKYFNIRLKRAGPRTEVPAFENVRVMSIHRPYNEDSGSSTHSSPRSHSGEVSVSSTINNDILILFLRICRPEPISVRLLEASRDEYVTRHLVDGRIINSDHRISLVIGYMTDEVVGQSAFKYMHKDDVFWAMIALRQMYERGQTKGGSCYRLLSRNNRFVYLKSTGFLEIDNGVVESFLCINQLIDEKEGEQMINDMKRRYSAVSSSIDSVSMPSNSKSDVVMENPKQLEEVLRHLMENLPASTAVESKQTTKQPRPKLFYQENKDCMSYVTEHAVKPYQPQTVKTVTKRPSNDIDASFATTKRHKSFLTQTTISASKSSSGDDNLQTIKEEQLIKEEQIYHDYVCTTNL